jgi:hypothetical protein
MSVKEKRGPVMAKDLGEVTATTAESLHSILELLLEQPAWSEAARLRLIKCAESAKRLMREGGCHKKL